MRIALVGAGNIAGRYAEAIAAAPGWARGRDRPRRRPRRGPRGRHGSRAYPDLAAVLADDAVETVVNLTVPQALAEVAARRSRRASTSTTRSRSLRHRRGRLVELAREHGVRLDAPRPCSARPSRHCGSTSARARWDVRAVYAEANWDRIERWHPDPQPLRGGAPRRRRRLSAHDPDGDVRARRSVRARRDAPRRAGAARRTPFTPGAPDFIVAVLEHEQEVVTRLTASFYVGPCKQRDRGAR